MNNPAPSTAAEQAILGAAILRASTIDEAIDAGLEPEDFSEPAHRIVWGAATALHAERKPVDMVTLPERLGASLDHHGGVFRSLADLTAACPSVANVAHYVGIVRSEALRRNLGHVAGEIRDAAEGGTAVDALALMEQRCGELRRRETSGKGWRHIGEVLEQSFASMQEQANNPQTVVGLPTGLTDLDALLTGLRDSDLIILASRPAMGKTSLALGVAVSAARAGAGVAVFELEMSDEQLGTRTLSQEARVSSHRMRTGKLKHDDWPALLSAVEGAAGLPIYVDASPRLTPSIMRAKIARLQATSGVGLVIADYIQLMRGDGKFPSRQEEVSSISRELKLIAKELGVPVVALAQLNRSCERRADKRPLMSDLKESGSLEQDADVVMFLYRDEAYNKRPDNVGLAEVLVRKHRGGAIGEVDVAWIGEQARFANREHGWRRPDKDAYATARRGYEIASKKNDEWYP